MDNGDKKNEMKTYHYFVIGVCLSLGLFSFSVYAENVTQIDRYSTVENKPTRAQINPLMAVAYYKFPVSIKTVGEAVQMVLSQTGYALAPENHLSPSVKDVFGKPLPMTDRQLGPLSIKDVLTVLMGQTVFALSIDPLNRLVNFELKPFFVKASGVKHGRLFKK
ncbi:MAG: hypothetical protein K0R24_375 [Gammaproteobacteria bacterium]|nr:hypothetical protein [Gammaproteobacteria bacterium]